MLLVNLCISVLFTIVQCASVSSRTMPLLTMAAPKEFQTLFIDRATLEYAPSLDIMKRATTTEAPTTVSTSFPVISDSIIDGSPSWTIDVPVEAGLLVSIDLNVTKTGPFKFTNIYATVNGETANSTSINFTDDSIALVLVDEITVNSTNALQLFISGSFTSDGTASIKGTISVTKQKSNSEVEADGITYELDSSINSGATSASTTTASSVSVFGGTTIYKDGSERPSPILAIIPFVIALMIF